MDFFHLYRFGNKIFLQKNHSEEYIHFESDWDELINQPNLYEELEKLYESLDKTSAIPTNFDAPIGNQEIWAAGVTYLRSKEARMEESKESGGDTFYDLVYSATRPEVFYKGNKFRAVGHNGKVSIRKDSNWDVPEPELTLVINNRNELIGYTVGNDMSSRSIEGENPLYLPQAKVFNNCAGIGPGIMITKDPLPKDTVIKMWIKRAGKLEFEGETTVSMLKRSFDELIHYLTMECDFPKGVYMMTGTCIVPDLPFTLQSGDEIFIQIDPIGTLKQQVK